MFCRNRITGTPVPHSELLPAMMLSSDDGPACAVEDLGWPRRFLILGSGEGNY